MPSVNIFAATKYGPPLKDVLPRLRQYIAEQLSCPERRLDAREVSIRLIETTDDSLQISPVELEITAFHYPSRIARQDEICVAVARFLEEQNAVFSKSVHVWLLLCELGHSWDEAS